MQLGAFSISLAVKDLEASRKFYEAFGFESKGGEPEKGYLILKNGDAVIGLFQGMFDKNTLTFNPGWDTSGKELSEFTDVRELKAELAKEELRFSFTPAMNQQKVLWTAARSIREKVRARAPGTEYVLLAHFVAAPDREEAFGAHLYLFDRGGRCVIVDFQNSHHDDFRRDPPNSPASRVRLAAQRLEAHLR